jgi:hypothetical protein
VKNNRQAKYLILAATAILVCIHSLWNIIAVVVLPLLFSALIFMWMGGIGKLLYYRRRRR